MTNMNGIYLLLGSNLGNRLQNLRKAVSLLRHADVKTLKTSSIYETAPWGNASQRWFLNLEVLVETRHLPEELLKTCQRVEAQMGRVRKEKWGDRLIDIDILYYHSKVINSENLTIPHSEIPNRRFTLVPLCELCPKEIHPHLNRTHVELLANCTDVLDCKRTNYSLQMGR